MLPKRISAGIAAACALVAVLAPSIGHADGAFRAVLVIDASSSMRRTDPRDLRKAAAELFVDLARDGDRLAVTGFDQGARQSTNGFQMIDGIEARQRVKAAIRAIGNDGQWTDFTAGLGEARRLLAGEPRRPGDQDLVLFLTDGKCEPDPASALAARGETPAAREAACQAEILEHMVGALDGARVYAIGLSRGAPADFLAELGRRTGGRGVVTMEPAELPRLFAEVYARLLGSRLQEGGGRGAMSFQVYEGAESLDLVLAGRARTTERLTGPDGVEIAIDNRAPEQVYFAGTEEYRLYKIARPSPGEWSVVLPGARSRYATLQHFDLALTLMEPPAVVEHGRSVALRARLSTAGGAIPPADFLDRHRLSAVIATGAQEGAGGARPAEVRVVLQRQDSGTFAGQHTPAALGPMRVRLVLEPGPDGMLQRETGVLATIEVIPPVHLAAAPIEVGPVKQGATVDAVLSLAGSELGAPIDIELAVDAPWLSLSPARATVPADGAEAKAGRMLPLTLRVAADAPAGAASPALAITPVPPEGFPGDMVTSLADRALTVPVSIEVVPLTLWERYGAYVQYGGGALVALVLLLGWLVPARFPKRAILHYKDIRDPELVRQSSYPLGVKVRAGLFRGARVRLGPTGPVKRGGVVVLAAAAGGAVEARPMVAGAVVRKAAITDEDADMMDGEGPRVPLDQARGSFRMSPGTGYTIEKGGESAGLVFWYK